MVLFPEKPFNSLCELLGTFSKVHLAEHHPGDTSNLASADTLVMGNEGSLIWHVTNVVARFRSIAEVTTQYVSLSCTKIERRSK